MEKTAQTSSSMILDVMGYQINLMSVMILMLILGILYTFWRIQKNDKLDFSDMIVNNGTRVSLSKVLQLVGGITATWAMIKLTLTGGLTEALFGLYLTYVGAVEGYSKYVAAKYGYNEKSIKEAANDQAEADKTGK